MSTFAATILSPTIKETQPRKMNTSEVPVVTCGNNQSDATAVRAAMKPEFNGMIALVDTQTPPSDMYG